MVDGVESMSILKKKMRSDLDICVCNPMTDKFTTFEIVIKTCNPAFTLGHSRTRRRYNDFVWLKKLLKSHHPLCSPPELPEKKTSSERFEPQFLVQRMKELEDWLYQIVDETLYFSDSVFHLFLQTNLSCKQIQLYLKGNLSEDMVQRGYQHANQGQGDSSEPVSASSNPPGPVSASPPISVKQESRGQDSPRENADSGTSVNESESDMDSSSYESNNSAMHSGDSAVLTGFPEITEVTTNLHRTSLNPGHVTPTGSVNTPEDSIERVTSCGNNSCDETEHEGDENKTTSPSHRVEMGVIYVVNS